MVKCIRVKQGTLRKQLTGRRIQLLKNKWNPKVSRIEKELKQLQVKWAKEESYERVATTR